ncbi:MAG: histidine phosphatase family protein, partial [Pseudomonadota bacterium]
SFYAERDRQGAQTAALRQTLNALPAGRATVLVSHQVNITALTGVYPDSGEALILAWPLGEVPEVLARLPPP